jgi:hypothetical protein
LNNKVVTIDLYSRRRSICTPEKTEAILMMAQVCSVMGKGLGLLPNRALSASVRRPSANDDRLKMSIAEKNELTLQKG